MLKSERQASPYFVLQLSTVFLRCFAGAANVSIARARTRRNAIY